MTDRTYWADVSPKHGTKREATNAAEMGFRSTPDITWRIHNRRGGWYVQIERPLAGPISASMARTVGM